MMRCPTKRSGRPVEPPVHLPIEQKVETGGIPGLCRSLAELR